MQTLLQNTYAALPERFYQKILPAQFPDPTLIFFNSTLARDLGIQKLLGLEDQNLTHELEHAKLWDFTTEGPQKSLVIKLAKFFCGQKLIEGSLPIAQAYAGHQFGHFNSQLGDGRALLLGECVDSKGERRDIQLKGAGQTAYSRRGDGRAALGPMMREYILSEAMSALGVPSSRALALTLTGEVVMRQQPEAGAIFTRVASSHIRVGTFEYFAARNDVEALELLGAYLRQRHFRNLELSPHKPYVVSMFDEILNRQADLISTWMSLGFVHGVMNTDNMFLSGETLDYGPCAFMDAYDPNFVLSSIDRDGRYAYSQQARIALWNLKSLANTWVSWISKLDYNGQPLGQERSVEFLEESLNRFSGIFELLWRKKICAKVGIFDEVKQQDLDLVQELLSLMAESQADFTNTFRALSSALMSVAGASSQKNIIHAGADESDVEANFGNSMPKLFTNEFAKASNRVFLNKINLWIARWQERVASQSLSFDEIKSRMNKVNPAIIPRNHQVQAAILEAEEALVSGGVLNFNKMKKLLDVLAHPYQDNVNNKFYSKAPLPHERVYQTFCGT